MVKVSYASAVGTLIYALVCTRPDLAYVVSLVSRFISNPGKDHWQAIKSIFRQIKGTVEVGLIFKHAVECVDVVSGYVGSDYAGIIDTRRSLTRYIFTVYGTSVSWKATLQHVVALSTTEAEYIVVTVSQRRIMDERFNETTWI